MSSGEDMSDLQKFAGARLGGTAFIQSLGGEVVEITRGRGRMRLPYAPQLVGDPDTGVVHGGVITAMLDQTCGIAVASALNEIMPFATLDLRIDYMKPAEPHADIFVEAECLKVTHEVAFTRGIAYQTSRDQPIALSTGTFMLIRWDRDSKRGA
jgi:uncharacterized protein (TIGR00369 family)